MMAPFIVSPPVYYILLMLQKSKKQPRFGWSYKTLENNGKTNYQPQLVIAGFLNHQQYVIVASSNPSSTGSTPR